uniref:LCORL n=1 Tax=Steinernema glaseri TaxID=37863 RepID=A0A1I8A482_9BILA
MAMVPPVGRRQEPGLCNITAARRKRLLRSRENAAFVSSEIKKSDDFPGIQSAAQCMQDSESLDSKTCYNEGADK